MLSTPLGLDFHTMSTSIMKDASLAVNLIKQAAGFTSLTAAGPPKQTIEKKK